MPLKNIKMVIKYKIITEIWVALMIFTTDQNLQLLQLNCSHSKDL